MESHWGDRGRVWGIEKASNLVKSIGWGSGKFNDYKNISKDIFIEKNNK